MIIFGFNEPGIRLRNTNRGGCFSNSNDSMAKYWNDVTLITYARSIGTMAVQNKSRYNVHCSLVFAVYRQLVLAMLQYIDLLTAMSSNTATTTL